jgi:hypothetical protein
VKYCYLIGELSSRIAAAMAASNLRAPRRRCSMRVYDSAGNVIETHKHARFQTTRARNRARLKALITDSTSEKSRQPFIRSHNEA